MRNGSEIRDPLVTYEGSNPPASPLQGDPNQQSREDKVCGSLAAGLIRPSTSYPVLSWSKSCLSLVTPELHSPRRFSLTPPVFIFTDNLVIALHSYEPSHDGDLGFEKGEQLRILEQ